MVEGVGPGRQGLDPFEALGGVVHTHSSHAVSWAQAEREVPCLGTTHADRGELSEASDRPSPLRTATIPMADTTAVLCYGAPSARDREIMGGLVPYDTPWRMGANEATAIHLPVAAEIGGVELEPGSYSLWAEPGQEEWTIHVSDNHERWGIPINEEVRADHVGEFTLQPETLDEPVEAFEIAFEPEDGHGGGVAGRNQKPGQPVGDDLRQGMARRRDRRSRGRDGLRGGVGRGHVLRLAMCKRPQIGVLE